MQYVTHMFSSGGSELTFRPNRKKVNQQDISLIVKDEGTDIDYQHEVFKFISKQDFSNNKNIDPRVSKLCITLLLLGVNEDELPIIFSISINTVRECVKFAKELLQNRYRKINIL